MYFYVIHMKYKENTKDDFGDFDIERVRSQEKKKYVLSIRVTKQDFEWIKKNKISATRLFNYCLHRVMKHGTQKT